MSKQNQTTEITNEQTNKSPEEVSPTPQQETKEDPKEEVKAPQKTEEVEVKETETDTAKDEALVETLRAEIEELKQAQINSDNLSAELETVKTDLTTKETLIAEYEGILTTIAEAKLEAIPQKFHALVPSQLTLTQKLEWLNTAEETGLFKTNEVKAPEIEIGKPMNHQPAKVDTSKLTGTDLMRMAYNTITKK